MLLTIGDWVLIAILGLIGIGVAIFVYDGCSYKSMIIPLIITLVICVVGVFVFNWYHGHTASGIRSYKDFESELSNGINREIVITAEDGREIFRFEGKFDVERHANGDDRYLRFETQDGLRYTISYGIQDTVLIIEKEVTE